MSRRAKSVTLDFAMEPAPVQLDEIVSTVTGEQRKLEVANAVSTIDAAAITQEAPITEFGNLLSGRAAGVTVSEGGGTTGSGTRIRIRGSNSVSSATSRSTTSTAFGWRPADLEHASTSAASGRARRAPSRINDIEPEDIESIEIVKGPAAATLYGIQASNGWSASPPSAAGAGRPRWNLYSEVGGVHDANTYPINYNGRDTTARPARLRQASASCSSSSTGSAPRPPSASSRR
jgi:outer membrane receptor protein involved in Fe transport